MLDVPSEDLFSAARTRHSPETGDAVRDWFEGMALPLPQAEEYTETSDGGYIVFLNKISCAIRITPLRQALPRHSSILRPLFQRAAGGCRIDINPGILCPVTDKDSRLLLKKVFFDKFRYNAGYLPGYKNDDGKPYAVVLDPGHCYIIEQEKDSDGAQQLSPQDILYGDLRRQFEKAWPKTAAAPDGASLSKAWEGCRKLKQSGHLVSSWLTDSMKIKRYKNLYFGSLAYEYRLTRAKIDF